MSQEDNFEAKLEAVVRAYIPECEGLVSADRLSGGASQETYRLVVKTASGERKLAMRRAPVEMEEVRKCVHSCGHGRMPRHESKYLN